MKPKSMLNSIIVISTIALVIMPTSAIKAQTINSTKLQNCTWLLPSNEGLQLMNASPSVWQETVIRLKNVNINCIIIWAGTWNTDHTINYADLPAVWTQFIKTVKAVDPDFKVLALVGTGGVDISNSDYREAMLNSVKQLMTSAPFDGWNDDLESFSGSNQNLIDYWQSVATLVKSMGKIATVDIGVDWSYKVEEVYPYLTNFDYIMPMFYWRIEEANALSYWNRILSSSAVPVIMGLDVDEHEMNYFSMSQQLTWIDQTLNSSSHSNLDGFSIWAYDYWGTSGGTSDDFAAWANWAVKNSGLSPALTSLEVTIIIAAAIATLAVVAALLFKKKAKKQLNLKSQYPRHSGRCNMTLPKRPQKIDAGSF